MKVEVQSGFQRGGTLSQWTGTEFVHVRRASENTWVGDGDSSFSVDLPDDFKGVVTRFHGISALSYCAEVSEFIGFSEAELKAPAPEKGWASKQSSCCRATDDWRVETFADWVKAKLLAGGNFVTDTELCARLDAQRHSVSGEILVHWGYECGDQAADGWLVYSKDGEYLRCQFGAGDTTPEPVVGEIGWEFTSRMEEDQKAAWEEDRRVYAAIDAGEQRPEIRDHLRSCYRHRQNPLPTMRKQYGGTWTFKDHTPYGYVAQGERCVLFTQHYPSTPEGFGWSVKWTPAQ